MSMDKGTTSDNGTRAQETEAVWGAPKVHQLLYALYGQPTLQLPQMAARTGSAGAVSEPRGVGAKALPARHRRGYDEVSISPLEPRCMLTIA